MDQINKKRLRTILLLSLVTVLLLGGIFANQFVQLVLSSSSPTPYQMLPSIKSENFYGGETNDYLVDGFFVGNDRYIFYNNEHGVMEKTGTNVKSTSFEGQILDVTLTSFGFVLAIKNDDKISIQSVGIDGIPTYFYSINLQDAQLQYLDYDGDVCLAVQHRGDYDYVLSYYKLNDELKEVYRRDIYSLYNLSTVSVFPLSNKTIIFFNATYGSVKRGGYTVLHNLSLSMTTEYFSNLSDYVVTDAKPYQNGFIVSVLEKNLPRAILLDENFNETLISIAENETDDIKIYTDSNVCYLSTSINESVDLYTIDNLNLEKEDNFADKIYDCLFFDNVAVFAIKKKDTTYILHTKTGIISPIINGNPNNLVLKNHKRLCFFATMTSPFLASMGSYDVYFASLL